jgi:hypothetical protein
MRGLVVILLVAMISLVPVAVCFANGEEAPVEPAGEELVAGKDRALVDDPSDWFALANLRSGFMWNVESETWTGYATLPVYGWKALVCELGLEIDPEAEGGPRAGVLGLTYRIGDLQSFGVQMPGAEHIGFNVGPVIKHNFETGENELAVLLSFIDLTLDDGNVDRQRSR